jgi:hypothetical protein
MSTILKALRRLEKDKAPAGRPLRDQVTREHDAAPAERRAPRRWPILAGSVGAGVLAGLAVLLLFFRGGSEPPAPEPAPPAAAPAVAPAPAPAAPPAAASPSLDPAALRAKRRAMRQAALRAANPPAPPPVEGEVAAPPVEPEVAPAPPGPPPPAPDVAVIDRGAPGPRIAEEAPAVPSATATDSPPPPAPGSARPFNPADPDAPAGVAVAPAPAAPKPAAAEPASVSQPAKASKPAVDSAPAAPKPSRAAPAFPALRVERTTWHPSAARRVALVEIIDTGSREVREGDRVEGAVVLRIEPSGIVFEHAGREVRRKVGE